MSARNPRNNPCGHERVKCDAREIKDFERQDRRYEKLAACALGLGLLLVAGPKVAEMATDAASNAFDIKSTHEETLERQATPEDECTVVEVSRNNYSLLADQIGEGGSEIRGALNRLSDFVLHYGDGTKVAVCFNEDYPGSGNKIMPVDNIRAAASIVEPDDYNYFTPTGTTGN